MSNRLSLDVSLIYLFVFFVSIITKKIWHFLEFHNGDARFVTDPTCKSNILCYIYIADDRTVVGSTKKLFDTICFTSVNCFDESAVRSRFTRVRLITVRYARSVHFFYFYLQALKFAIFWIFHSSLASRREFSRSKSVAGIAQTFAAEFRRRKNYRKNKKRFSLFPKPTTLCSATHAGV